MRLGRSLLSGVALSGLLLAGCSSTQAIYRHPTTGAMMYCEQMPGTAFEPRFGIAYSECKAELESKGYERIGSAKGDASRAVEGLEKPLPYTLSK